MEQKHATGILVYRNNWPLASDLVDRTTVISVLNANPTWFAEEILNKDSCWYGNLDIRMPINNSWISVAIIAPYPQK